ncbi:MAG: hypothetical protein KDK70_11970, partial [Myxococcales bacterium]|nr:hypothetical protein [Myxococcales bacterium]
MCTRSRSLLAISLGLALGAAGCNKETGEGDTAPAPSEPALAPQGEGSADADAKAKAEPGEPSTPTTPATPTAAASPAALAATVESMLEAEFHYPASLDPLLDLLPAGAEDVVVVRDVDGLLAMADAMLQAVDPTMRSIAAAAGGDAPRKVDAVLSGYRSLQTGLRGSDFALGEGLAVARVGSDTVVIYGTSRPDALPSLLRSLGAEGDDLPDACTAIEGAPGHAVCAAEPATLAAYTPGKDAAGARARLAERLGTEDVERANVLATVMGTGKSAGEQVAFTVATSPGLAHFTMGLEGVPEEVGALLGSGPSPALGLTSPGGGFYWLKLDPASIAEKAKDQEFIVRNVLGALTGELLLGSVASSDALVMLAGIDDPGPVAGLIAMASLALDRIPKTLPDGSGLEVGVESISVAGKSAQVLHAKLTPAGKSSELLAKTGLRPEAWVFAAGGYAGVVLGGDASTIETIASYGGGAMSPEGIQTLPKPLARSIADGQVSVVMHVPIDGMQSPQVGESFEAVAKDLPADDLPPGMTPSQILTLVRSVTAPVSGISMWMAPPKDRMVFHLALSLMGDGRTEQGRAELAAMAAVAGGSDPAAAYGELASRFASSPRAVAYQARAGTRTDGALTSAAMLGVVAAVAIPVDLLFPREGVLASNLLLAG